MSDLTSMLGPDLVREIERLVDERVRVALADREGRDSGSPWLTIREAADRLRISERTVARHLARGRLRSVHFGSRRLLHRDDCDELLRATAREDVAPTTPPRRRPRSVDRERADG